MTEEAGILYLVSRVVTAAGNLFAVMLFTRLAGTAEYGHYLLIFAWSLIAYGFGAQWMKVAYFGVFHPSRFGEYVGSLKRLLALGITAVGVVLTGLYVFGLAEIPFLFAVFTMVCGLTLYEAAFEIARTLLAARAAAFSMLLRTVLTFTLGGISLVMGGGALGLAMAIALAHVVAALPALWVAGGFNLSSGSRAASLHIARFGWPLFLSFGVNAAGSSIDRLLIAHYAGASALGSYGVVADLLRQTFIVFGDAIILSLVTLAKRHANAGDTAAAHLTLQKAFNACLVASSLGAAFFIVFGEFILRLILKPEFIQPVYELIPILALAFGFLTMRSYYFAQAIYFARTSHAELYYAILFLVVSASFSLILIPSFGLKGAAYAFLAAATFSFIAAVFVGRLWYRLPIDPAGIRVVPALAVLLVFGALWAKQVFPETVSLLILDPLAFILCAIYAVRRFDLWRTGTPGKATGELQVTTLS